MLKVILASLFILSAPVHSASTPFVDILTAQAPFYVFPEEKNGLYKIEMAYTENCQFAFRDSLEFHPGRKDGVKYTSTKVFHLSDLDFAFIDYEQAPNYYRVYFGSNNQNVINVVGTIISDRTGNRNMSDTTVTQSLIRFKNLEDAEQAWSYLTDNMDKCRKK